MAEHNKPPKLGAVGEFPEGKIGPSDEGQLVFGITHDLDTKRVHINFGTSVTWLAMSPEEAIKFAKSLMFHAGVQ